MTSLPVRARTYIMQMLANFNSASPTCSRLIDTLPSTSGRDGCGTPWSDSVLHAASCMQSRGYKSNKKPLKPQNTAASWRAVKPFLPFAARDELLLQQSGDGRPPIVDTCIPTVPEASKPIEYRRVGLIESQYSIDLQKLFAVVEIAGTQFKVTPDDVFFVNQLQGTDINDVLQLDRVMLLGSREETVIGRPYVPGGSVLVAVEEHFRDGKVHVFKRNPRKRYRKYMTTRPHLTTLRVLQIRGIEAAPGDVIENSILPITWQEAAGDELENQQDPIAMQVGK